MFSRVFLGMHSINQVLFGLLIGIYSFVPYYLYVERWIIWMCLEICRSKKPLTELLIIYAGVFIAIAVEVMITFVPTYNNSEFLNVIHSTAGCENVMEARSFQYRCF